MNGKRIKDNKRCRRIRRELKIGGDIWGWKEDISGYMRTEDDLNWSWPYCLWAVMIEVYMDRIE